MWGMLMLDVIHAISGSLKSTIQLVHAKAIVQGVQNQAIASVTLSNGRAIETVYGYPAANSRDLPLALDHHFGREIVSTIIAGSWNIRNIKSVDCYVRYFQPSLPRSSYRLVTHDAMCD